MNKKAFYRTAPATPGLWYISFKEFYIVYILQASNLAPRYHIDGFSMTIKKVKREDAGRYLFQAKNDIGETTMEIFLNIFYAPK